MKGAVIDRLSDEDTQILKLDHGAIRGHTCKVLVLERTQSGTLPSVATVRDRVASRLDGAPRFRRRVMHVPLRVANPVWIDDPAFDIANHVTAADTDGPLTRRELTRLVARLMGEPLRPDRPLWHIAVVERLEDHTTALIWRMHHCLADGTTAMRLAESVLWDAPDPAPDSHPARPWQPAPAPSRLSLFAGGLAERARPRRTDGLPRPRFVATRPAESALARELAPTATRTPLSRRVGAQRSVSFAAVPFRAAHDAGKAICESITVNDVVLSIVAGGIREWLGPHGAIRVKVPVSLHHAGDPLGNHDSFFFVDLPVAEPDPVRRVLTINRETRERKLAGDAETLYRLGTHHHLLERWAMSPHVFTFNVSNVPGPRGDVFLLAARLREMYSLAEIAQHHALRVAVLSAAGSLSFGLCADLTAVPDLEKLAAGIRRAADELLALAG